MLMKNACKLLVLAKQISSPEKHGVNATPGAQQQPRGGPGLAAALPQPPGSLPPPKGTAGSQSSLVYFAKRNKSPLLLASFLAVKLSALPPRAPGAAAQGQGSSMQPCPTGAQCAG